MDQNQPLSSGRDGRHGGGSSSRHGTNTSNSTSNSNSNGSFQQRRFDGDTTTHRDGSNNRESSWSDNRRDHQGGGGGRFERRDVGGGGRGGESGGSRGGDTTNTMTGDNHHRGPPGAGDNNNRGPPRQQQQHQHQKQGGGGGYNGNNPRGPQARIPRGPPTPQEIERANTPIPPEQRRTLVLSNVPHHLKFFQIQQHFQNHWNSFVQYSLMDRTIGEAYVRFKFVEDAKRVWEGGSEGLDGTPSGGGGGGSGSESWVAMGITLKAVHITNYMIDSRQTDNNQPNTTDNRNGGDRGAGGGGGFDRKRSWKEPERGGGFASVNGVGGGHSHNIVHPVPPPPPPSKMPRYSEQQHFDRNVVPSNNAPPPPSHPGNYNNNDQYYDPPQQQHYTPLAASNAAAAYPNNNGPPNSSGNYDDQYYDPSHQQQQHYTPPVSAHAMNPATYPSNNTYHRSPMTQQANNSNTLTPIELQLQQQKDAEEQQHWEAFQTQESEWRQRRQAEYAKFIHAKNARLDQISTLEQKRDLLSKQESMLTKQLPLHKKMLSVLQAKKASPSEQSKKMKEILSKQTRIMELKKERKNLVEKMEGLKEVESESGVFRPSEKRPIYVGGSSDGGVGKMNGSVGGVDGGGSTPQKRSLDRRTTVLRVEGFSAVEEGGEGGEGEGGATEDAIKEHFTTFGTVMSVNLEKPSVDDETASLFALVTFANRVDAERAKSSNTKLKDINLSCTWHNSTPSDGAGTLGNGEGTNYPAAYDDDTNVADGLYDDVGGGDYEEAAPPPPENEENVDYDYEGEEDNLVDYD